LTISVIAIVEVIRGFQRNQSFQRQQSFLSAIAAEEVLPFDQAAAELAGHIEEMPRGNKGSAGKTRLGYGLNLPIYS
jgi:predicted nucleic acid-binding protein